MTRPAVSRLDLALAVQSHWDLRVVQGATGARAMRSRASVHVARVHVLAHQPTDCPDLTDEQCRAIVADVRGLMWPEGSSSEEWGSELGEYVSGVEGLRPPQLR